MPPNAKSDYRFTCQAGTAEIFLYDEIDRLWGIGANQIRNDLQEAGTVSLIRVRINSEGGNIFEGLAIYNLLRDHSARVEMMVDGMALSMASLIAMAGDDIEMAENAYMMIHNPVSQGFADADEHRKMAALLDSFANTLAETYSARSGQSVEQVLALMEDETWLTASQAVEKGFATRIGKSLSIAAHVDPKRFANTPVSLIEKLKEPEMADTNDQTTTVAVTSFKELKAALPGADNDFLVSQLESEATVPQAQTAWMAEQGKRITDKDTALAKLQKDAIAKKKEVAAKPGLDVKGEGTGGTDQGDALFDGDPEAEFDKRVRAKMSPTMDRKQAALAVARSDKELHKAYLQATNPKRRRIQDQITDRFEEED